MMSQLDLTPREFVGKWRKAELKKHAAAQQHFFDVCRTLGNLIPVGRGLCVPANEAICENC